MLSDGICVLIWLLFYVESDLIWLLTASVILI